MTSGGIRPLAAAKLREKVVLARYDKICTTSAKPGDLWIFAEKMHSLFVSQNHASGYTLGQRERFDRIVRNCLCAVETFDALTRQPGMSSVLMRRTLLMTNLSIPRMQEEYGDYCSWNEAEAESGIKVLKKSLRYTSGKGGPLRMAEHAALMKSLERFKILEQAHGREDTACTNGSATLESKRADVKRQEKIQSRKYVTAYSSASCIQQTISNNNGACRLSLWHTRDRIFVELKPSRAGKKEMLELKAVIGDASSRLKYGAWWFPLRLANNTIEASLVASDEVVNIEDDPLTPAFAGRCPAEVGWTNEWYIFDNACNELILHQRTRAQQPQFTWGWFIDSMCI